MKFLVYGADGWIGSCISKILLEAGDTVVKGQRVTSVENVSDDLELHRPDRVVCSVGRTHGPGNATIDYLEAPGKLHENLQCNLSAPLLIAQATLSASAGTATPTLYIGSGCIFQYDDDKHTIEGGQGFTEDCFPNFFGSSYSIVKGQTDTLMRAFPHLISARIRMPITNASHPRDFITKILSYKNVCSQPNSMTVLSDCLPFLIACLVEKMSGTINAVNPGVIEHQQILTMYQAVFQRTHRYQLISQEEQDSILLARRSNNYLSTSKVDQWIAALSKATKDKYGVPDTLPGIEQKIQNILEARLLQEATLLATPKVKVILVTGGAGFIGSNFINFWMNKSPQDVIVNFDCLEAHSNLRNIENPGGENYTFVRGNLLDKACVEEVFERRRFTHIVHFAAASNVDQSFIKPVSCTLSNVLGTHNLLEAARNCGSLKLFLLISTDEVYGETPSGDCLEEGSVFCPTNPYAASKAAAECLVMAYGKSYKMPWIITRSNNVYGKYQFPTQALPKFLTCLLTGQKMPIHGDGKMRRKFIHVQDKCRALQILIDRGSLAEVYNIGTSDELTVLELCQVLLKNVLGPGHELGDFSVHLEDRCYNDCRYSVSALKLRKLGWRPEISFQDGLKDTVQWYSGNRDHWANLPHFEFSDKSSGFRNQEGLSTHILTKQLNDGQYEGALISAQVKYEEGK